MAGSRSRIVIVGTTGAGKSTLATRLVDRFGLEFIELDALHWGPNWKAASVDDFRIRTAEATRAEGWVVAGNYPQGRGNLLVPGGPPGLAGQFLSPGPPPPPQRTRRGGPTPAE